MNRRGFLGRAALAPFAAGHVAKQAGRGIIAESVVGGSAAYGEALAEPREPSPLQRKFWKAQSILRRRAEAKDRAGFIGRGAPYYIETKKSWSPAFKAHVFEHDTLEQSLRRDSEEMVWHEIAEDAAMRRLIKLAGLSDD